MANFVVKYLTTRGSMVSNKKLQKLLYYIQAWHFAYFNKENIYGETLPEAWVYGPVYPEIYKEYKEFGYNPIQIEESITEKDVDTLLESFGLSNDQQEYILAVLKEYGTKNAFDLQLLTHQELPWKNARKGCQQYESSSKTIEVNDMTSYYGQFLDGKE